MTQTKEQADVFLLLETLKDALRTNGYRDLSLSLGAGFARGTDGVDIGYIVNLLVVAIQGTLERQASKTNADVVRKLRRALGSSQYPDFILPEVLPKPEPTTGFLGRSKPTIITPEIERWGGMVARQVLIEVLESILQEPK